MNQPISLPVERALKKFGNDIRIARLKRGFTALSLDLGKIPLACLIIRIRHGED